MNAPTELLELTAYTLLLHLLFFTSLVNPLTVPPYGTSPSIRSRLRAFHSVAHTSFAATVYTPSTNLPKLYRRKRSFVHPRQPQTHWHLHITRSTALIPAFAIAHNFEGFYTAILDIAQNNHFTDQNQFYGLRFWEGHREYIEFQSLAPIPWLAIRYFAVTMLAMVRRGRIDGSYEGYLDSGQGNLIGFWMNLGSAAD